MFAVVVVVVVVMGVVRRIIEKLFWPSIMLADYRQQIRKFVESTNQRSTYICSRLFKV